MNRIHESASLSSSFHRNEGPSGKLGQRQVESRSRLRNPTFVKASLAGAAVLALLGVYAFMTCGQSPNPPIQNPPQDPESPANLDACIAELSRLRDEFKKFPVILSNLLSFEISDLEFCSKSREERRLILEENLADPDHQKELEAQKGDCVDPNESCPVPTKICVSKNDPDLGECNLEDEDSENVKSFLGDSLPSSTIEVLDCRPVNQYVKRLLKDDCQEYNLIKTLTHSLQSGALMHDASVCEDGSRA